MSEEVKDREFCSSLTHFLEGKRDEKFTVIQPGGNNGDLLIYKGLNKKLVELGIRYKDVKYRKTLVSWGLSTFNKHFRMDVKDIFIDDTDIILMHGGGNMNDFGYQGFLLFKHLIKYYPNSLIVVAPQTYSFSKVDFKKLLGDAKQKIILFCRDETSFSTLKKIDLSNVAVKLSDDTAFYLTEKDFDVHVGKYVLLNFRMDGEASNKTDIKKIFRKKFRNEEIVEGDFSNHHEHSFEKFISVVSGAKYVVTDRLHVASLASILKKPVTLLPGSYFKNKAVYDYTLKHFPLTTFCEGDFD